MRIALVLGTAALLAMLASPALADGNPSVHGSTDAYQAVATQAQGPHDVHGSVHGETHSVSSTPQPPPLPGLTAACAGLATGSTEDCGGPPAAQPQVTPGLVAQAFAQVPVPHLASVTQPAGKTLVNFDTIFYVTAQPFTQTVTLLGHQVRLDVRPVSFIWDHGDGTTTTTATPGAAYPHKDVVHRYPTATTVRHHVAVTWAATYSVDGGPVADVPGTVTTTGPDTALRIVEATPVLTGTR